MDKNFFFADFYVLETFFRRRSGLLVLSNNELTFHLPKKTIQITSPGRTKVLTMGNYLFILNHHPGKAFRLLRSEGSKWALLPQAAQALSSQIPQPTEAQKEATETLVKQHFDESTYLQYLNGQYSIDMFIEILKASDFEYVPAEKPIDPSSQNS